MRAPPLVLFSSAIVLAAASAWVGWQAHRAPSHQTGPAANAGGGPAVDNSISLETPTNVYAHNLLLRKGPNFRIYIPWLRGQMLRTSPGRNPSFDNAESFVLNIGKGVIHVRLQDLTTLFNSGTIRNAPLTNVTLSANNGQVQLRGTAHKLVPWPVEIDGTLAATADNRVLFHVTHLNLLKVPMKGLLGTFDIKLQDLVRSDTPGVSISGNDVIFDTEKLLPPPHIRGQLTRVYLADDGAGPAIDAIYGSAGNDPTREQKWHNFLQLTDGTLDFGKLTMHHVDLIMIDASKDPWFDLDLVHYQAQLVNGITRMTPQAGLQIFMPDLDDMPPGKGGQTITMEWLRDRNLPPPQDIPYR